MFGWVGGGGGGGQNFKSRQENDTQRSEQGKAKYSLQLKQEYLEMHKRKKFSRKGPQMNDHHSEQLRKVEVCML